MKKYYFCCLFANRYDFLFSKVYAWWDVGAKLGYGLTGMLNNNLFDDRDYEHRLTTGLSYGAKAGMYFGLFNGITVDAMFSSNKQKFDYNFSDGKNYLHNVNWKILTLLYYIEIKEMAFILN